MKHSHPSRRIFLKTNAAAAFLPAAVMQAANVVTVAFMGVGNRGSYLLQHMLEVEGVRVVAVCDLFSHHYFDPAYYTGGQEVVFGSEGLVDLVKATWQPRERGAKPVQLDVPDQGKNSTYMALAAFADSIRNNTKPINDVDSAVQSTLPALMDTKAIYEKRIVTWEEVANA